MLNRDLRLALSYPHQFIHVFVVAPNLSGEDTRYGIDTAVDDGNLDGEPFTVIEVNDAKHKSATAGQIRLALKRFKPEDEVLIFIPGWEAQNFAYFAINSVRFDVTDHATTIILGDWRFGG
jgi:hypothetical protein